MMLTLAPRKDKGLAAWAVALWFLCSWVQPVGAQGILPPISGTQKTPSATFSLELPRRDQVFRLESDRHLLERIRWEGEVRAEKAQYPKETVKSPTVPPRPPGSLPPALALRVPYVVCYRPLYFEDKNTDRYGLSLGPVQPVVSTGIFYLNTMLLPLHLVTQPPWVRECNGGYFLPGDRVPWKLYLTQ